MALALTPGYAFATTEQVTAAKLASLVSSATASGVDITNFASGSGCVITSSSAPSNVNALWIDSASSNALKYYTGSTWAVVAATGAGTLGSFRNLAGVYASASTVTYTADEVVLEDSSNVKLIVRTLSATLSLASNGAVNKLDAGTVAANTLYYVWAISNGSTNGLLGSLSATAPTLPSGYTYKALIGVCGTNNSSNLIAYHQVGRRYTFDLWATLGAKTFGTWSTVMEAVDLTPAQMTTVAGFVPPAISKHCFGSYFIGAANAAISNLSTATGDGSTAKANRFTGVGGTFAWELDVLTADTIYAMSDNTMTVYLHGFDMNAL